MERRADLAAALDGLLVEVVGAAPGPVEAGLEAVADVEEQVDGAAGVRVGVDALAVADGLKVQHGRSGGKNPPIDRVGEGLLLRKAEARAWRREQRLLLAVSHHGEQSEGAKKGDCGYARLHRGGSFEWATE